MKPNKLFEICQLMFLFYSAHLGARTPWLKLSTHLDDFRVPSSLAWDLQHTNARCQTHQRVDT